MPSGPSSNRLNACPQEASGRPWRSTSLVAGPEVELDGRPRGSLRALQVLPQEFERDGCKVGAVGGIGEPARTVARSPCGCTGPCKGGSRRRAAFRGADTSRARPAAARRARLPMISVPAAPRIAVSLKMGPAAVELLAGGQSVRGHDRLGLAVCEARLSGSMWASTAVIWGCSCSQRVATPNASVASPRLRSLGRIAYATSALHLSRSPVPTRGREHGA